MSDRGRRFQVPAISFERQFDSSIETVWAHLTQCAKLPGWYGEDGIIEPREGGKLRLAGGHIRGLVTRWRPYRQLAYSWNVFGPTDTVSAYPESYLTFDLAPAATGTALKLLHLPVLERFEKQNAMGWHTYLDMLGAALRGDPVEPLDAYMQRNAARYGVDLENVER
jgi:uncharacterized protein YndB with AHSA1/START domain